MQFRFIPDIARIANVTVRALIRRISLCLILFVCAAGVLRAAEDDDVFGDAPATKPSATSTEPGAGESSPRETDGVASGERLYNRNPFDVLVLADSNRTQIEVEPIPFPARELPVNPNPKDKLIVHRLDQPQDDYEIVWKEIAEVKLFERMILAEGQDQIAKGDFDAAYDYFRWLANNRPNMRGLDEAIAAYYLADAEHWRAAGDHEKALIALDRLFERNRGAAGLAEAMGAVTDELVKARISEGHYASARRLLKRLRLRFPSSVVISDWNRRFDEQAAAKLAEAKQAEERGDWANAKLAIDGALVALPQNADALKVAEGLYAKRRSLNVGVSALAAEGADTTFDATARRVSRLLSRKLFEFSGIGPQGGIYDCPFGEVEWQELGRAAEIRLRNDVVISEEYGKLTAFDVARSLVRMAYPAFDGFDMAWSDLLAAVEARDTYTLRVELKHTHPQPAGMMQFSPIPPDIAASGVSFGPYVVKESTPEFRRYEVNPSAAAGSAARPQEIVELGYTDLKQALADLQSGALDVLARVHPADFDRASADSQLRVRAYATPTMHCLAPNFARPYPANRSLRRAIAYAIPREAILYDSVLRGKRVVGCQLTTGPFPRGAERSDPLGYAYNFDLAARPWEPRLAMTLAKVAVVQVEGEEGKKKKLPTLVLAYPADEVAQTACEQIQKRLAVLGIKFKLKQLPPGAPLAMPEDADFLYTALAIQDPIVDARRLLGAEGLLGRASPYMSLALRQLDRTDSWIDATAQLREIHRLSYDELSLIPLWQIQDHFAYHQRLTGVKDRPVSLYDGVEDWATSYRLPVEAQ